MLSYPNYVRSDPKTVGLNPGSRMALQQLGKMTLFTSQIMSKTQKLKKNQDMVICIHG